MAVNHAQLRGTFGQPSIASVLHDFDRRGLVPGLHPLGISLGIPAAAFGVVALFRVIAFGQVQGVRVQLAELIDRMAINSRESVVDPPSTDRYVDLIRGRRLAAGMNVCRAVKIVRTDRGVVLRSGQKLAEIHVAGMLGAEMRTRHWAHMDFFVRAGAALKNRGGFFHAERSASLFF